MTAFALDAAGIAGDPASPVHRLDARAKLLGLAGLTLIAATAPPAAWPLLASCAALLAAVARAARVPAGVLWRRARVILPLVVLAAASLPFLRHGGARYELGPLTASQAGLEAFGSAAAKAGVGTLSALLQAAATGRLATALFLRAHARAERVHTAMAARGWSGVPLAPAGAALRRADVA